MKILNSIWAHLRSTISKVSKKIIFFLVDFLKPDYQMLKHYVIINYKPCTIIASQIQNTSNIVKKNFKHYFKNSISEDHLTNYIYHASERWNCLISIAKSYKDKKGLNIGVAYGIYDSILRHCYGLEITGTELPKYIEKYCGFALSDGQNIVEWDIMKHKYSDESGRFDFILCAEVIEHLKVSPILFFRELQEMLKPEGGLILSTPNINRKTNIMNILQGGNVLRLFPDNIDFRENDVTNMIEHIREYTISETILLIEKAGFFIKQIYMCSYSGKKSSSPYLNDVITIHAIKNPLL